MRRPSSGVIEPYPLLNTLGGLDQLLGVDVGVVLRRAVLVVVRDHEPLALEVAALRHRPFHDDADPLAEHGWREAGGPDVNDLLVVGHVEVEGRAVARLDRAWRNHAAKTNPHPPVR